MKRILAGILVMLFLSPVFSYGEKADDNASFISARQIAHFMETHYGITILIGPECTSATTGDFVLGNRPEGRTPFMKMLGGKNYTHEIQLIDDTFSIYPPSFFNHFICGEAPQGLRILLADQILYEGQSMAGVTTNEDGVCTYNVSSNCTIKFKYNNSSSSDFTVNVF